MLCNQHYCTAFIAKIYLRFSVLLYSDVLLIKYGIAKRDADLNGQRVWWALVTYGEAEEEKVEREEELTEEEEKGEEEEEGSRQERVEDGPRTRNSSGSLNIIIRTTLITK